MLFALFSLMVAWAVFWIIRLAVRYGVDDALHMNRDWPRAGHGDHTPTK